MKSTTRTRKTARPSSDRWATSLPQLGPISVWEMSSALAPVVSRIVVTICSLSASSTGSVWTMIASLPDVVTTGCGCAASTPEPATASRSSSAVSWVTWSDGSVTRYSAPPVNSMPMLRPLDHRPRTATATMSAETAYQSQRAADEVDRALAGVEVVAEP